MAKFDYSDPDNQPVKNASIASIEITLTGATLCDCKKRGEITIEIEVDVHGNGNPWQNFNKVSRELGEFIIDGVVVQFKGAPKGAKNSQKDTASHTIRLDACPKGPQSGKGEIKVVDLTRKGKRTGFNWSGTSQIYEYTWSYECEKEEDKGNCISCKEKTAFKYDVKLIKSNTQQPNL